MQRCGFGATHSESWIWEKIRDILENGYKAFMNSVKYALSWGLKFLVFGEFTIKLLLLKIKVRNYLIC